MADLGPNAVPDRIAIDAHGYGWRVWDDKDYWSMVPTNPDNSPIPQPVTWFVVADLLPAEKMALTIASAQVRRGDAVPPNTATMLVMALERLTASTEPPIEDAGSGGVR